MFRWAVLYALFLSGCGWSEVRSDLRSRRGEGWAAETSAEQFEGMQQFLGMAAQDLDTAAGDEAIKSIELATELDPDEEDYVNWRNHRAMGLVSRGTNCTKPGSCRKRSWSTTKRSSWTPVMARRTTGRGKPC